MEEVERYLNEPLFNEIYEEILILNPDVKNNPDLFMEEFNNNFLDGFFIYFDDAINFLKKYDASLLISFDIVNSSNFDVLNSAYLANSLLGLIMYNLAIAKSEEIKEEV